jgi:hypothetical protein
MYVSMIRSIILYWGMKIISMSVGTDTAFFH